MVDGVSSSQKAEVIAALNGKKTENKSKVAETQDRFLKLLVTQMQNQDPLNPMDNAQVTSQMAQLSTVSGLDKVNQTLQALSESFLGAQTMQAANMIGRGVLFEGDKMELGQEGKALGGFNLPAAVEQLNVAIYDKAGVLVKNLNLEAQKAGVGDFVWDGTNNAGKAVAAGEYKFELSAKQGGKAAEATALQFGMVNSVTQGKQGVSLGVGTLDGVTMSQVRRIL